MTDFAQKPDSRTYIAIDLKSFYASVECAERNLDPLTTNLVVADASRTEKTICLAVSPSLKACGIPGRPRLFEVRPAAVQNFLPRRSWPPIISSLRPGCRTIWNAARQSIISI